MIGFVLVPHPTNTGNQTQYHYTEHRFNLQCTNCATKGPYYSTLIYKSKKLENTFYLGFEDLDFVNADGAAGTNGNDLDYEDFLFRFTGIACVGAGEGCTIEANKGACRLGVKECDGTGALTCKAITTPGKNAEKCDGVDNNCDGTVDENAPCPTGLICDRGRCTRNCDNEIPCPRGLSCDSGRCIESACLGMACPAGQLCRAGVCGDACAGVKCPSPSICSGGLCVDPCAGVTCAARQACVNGACIASCDCLPCAGTLACQAASGKCVEKGCENLTCGSGEVCQGGTCVGSCTGAVCPSGQSCAVGMCADDVVTDDMGTTDPGTDPDPMGGSVATAGCTCHLAPDHRATNALGVGAGLLLLGFAVYRSRRRVRN